MVYVESFIISIDLVNKRRASQVAQNQLNQGNGSVLMTKRATNSMHYRHVTIQSECLYHQTHGVA